MLLLVDARLGTWTLQICLRLRVCAAGELRAGDHVRDVSCVRVRFSIAFVAPAGAWGEMRPGVLLGQIDRVEAVVLAPCPPLLRQLCSPLGIDFGRSRVALGSRLIKPPRVVVNPNERHS